MDRLPFWVKCLVAPFLWRAWKAWFWYYGPGAYYKRYRDGHWWYELEDS